MTDATLPSPIAPPIALDGRTRTAPADLRDCMAIARQTLRQAADEAIALPDEMVDTLIGTEHALEAGGLTAEQESRFWKTYAYLRANVSTTSSLRRRYNYGFLALLALLMATQAVYISAASITDGIRTEWGIVRDYLLSETDFCKALTQPSAAPASTIAGTTGATTGTAANTAPNSGKAHNCPARIVTEPEYRTARIELHSYDHLLESYSLLLPGTTVNVQEIAAAEGDQIDNPRTLREYKHYVYLRAMLNVRRFMELFILPALYGALGAFAFVLRKFSDDLRDGTLGADSGSRYGLRISIGILCGLIIHAFVRPSDSDVVTGGDTTGVSEAVQHLSRYALAFVGGYGSEILFTMLDRMVAALVFTREPESNGGAATRTGTGTGARTGTKTGAGAAPKPAGAPAAETNATA